MHINYMTMWNDLSLKEKSSIMKDFVKRGYRDLASIEKDYNIFAEGGIPEGKEVRVQEEESPDMTSWTKEDLMKKLYYDENGVPRNKETGEYVPLSTPEYVVTPKNNIYRTADRLTWEDADRIASDAEAPLSSINTGAWAATIAYPNPVTPLVAGTTSAMGALIDGYQGIRSLLKGDYLDAGINAGETALGIIGNKGLALSAKSGALSHLNEETGKGALDKALSFLNARGKTLDPIVNSASTDLVHNIGTMVQQVSKEKDNRKSIFDDYATYAFGGGLKSPFSHSPIPAVRY